MNKYKKDIKIFIKNYKKQWGLNLLYVNINQINDV